MTKLPSLADLTTFWETFSTALPTHQIWWHSDHFCHIYSFFQVCQIFRKNLENAINGTKCSKWRNFWWRSNSIIKSIGVSNQIIKKEQFGALQFLVFLTKQSSENLDCKIRGHWGQQRQTDDPNDQSGINFQPSLNRKHP